MKDLTHIEHPYYTYSKEKINIINEYKPELLTIKSHTNRNKRSKNYASRIS